MNESQFSGEGRGARGWFPHPSLSAFKHEIQGMFETFLEETLPALRGESVPRLDVVETPSAVEITADLPGVTPEEISVDLVENHLTISGTRDVASGSDDPDRKVHRLERRRQTFSRSVWLPCPVDAEKIDAQLDRGVLVVRLPKLDGGKRRKIPVQGSTGASSGPESGEGSPAA